MLFGWRKIITRTFVSPISPSLLQKMRLVPPWWRLFLSDYTLGWKEFSLPPSVAPGAKSVECFFDEGMKMVMFMASLVCIENSSIDWDLFSSYRYKNPNWRPPNSAELFKKFFIKKT